MPTPDTANSHPSPLAADDRLLACLCAAWCGTCRDYLPVLEAWARAHPRWDVRWVDIEDHADALGELDIENFPTLLVAHGDALRFVGTVLPHAGTLARTVDAAEAAVLGVGEAELPDDLVAIVRRVGDRVG